MPFPGDKAYWLEVFLQQLPLLGHRNWIVIADAAYPLHSSGGIKTIETGADHFEVLEEILRRLKATPHVRPIVFLDQELQFVSDQDAFGVNSYRQSLSTSLGGLGANSLMHEQIIDMLNAAGESFQILIFKTTLIIPYTSIFLQLDCKYWTEDAERALRKRLIGQPAGGDFPN